MRSVTWECAYVWREQGVDDKYPVWGEIIYSQITSYLELLQLWSTKFMFGEIVCYYKLHFICLKTHRIEFVDSNFIFDHFLGIP